MVKRAVAPALSVLVLAVAFAGCDSQDSNPAPVATVSGVVSSDATVDGSVSLKDASDPSQERTATVDDSGGFAFDVAGLTAPFLLEATSSQDGATVRMSSVALQAGRANINPITDAAVKGADDESEGASEAQGDGERIRRTARRFETLIGLLQAELKPLFDVYQVPADPFTDHRPDPALRTMLEDVRIEVVSRSVVVTNKQTGGVIFSGPLSDISSGTFSVDHLPGAPGTPPPPPPACTYSYSDWGACQPDGTQTRTVASSTPAGCAGTPVGTQPCTYVPPPPPPPATCTSFTYSAWGACQPDDTQTRTVTGSSPAGCTGGSPVTSQSCTYVPPPPPPPATCTSFTYSAWGACQPSNTQTRAVTGSSPAGCTGGSPVTSQSCTYVPPACTYTYSAWSACSASGTQTRTVVSSAPAGCAGTPVLSQACTPPPPTTSCTGCHGIPPATGKHAFHSTRATCATCHGSGYSTTTANAATHMNGVKNLAATAGWNATSRTCANSCHGSKSW